MSWRLEGRVKEVAIWWDHHKRDATDVHKRLDLHAKCIENMFDLLAMAMDDIRALEGRTDSGRPLWVPRGVKVNGDLTRVG